MSDDARVQLSNQKRQRFAERRKREDKARKKKREEEEEEASRKRTCQNRRSSDRVVLGQSNAKRQKILKQILKRVIKPWTRRKHR